MLGGSKESREAARALMQFGSLGVSLAAGVALFSWVGFLLDRRFGTEPYLLATLCLLGGGLGLYKLIRDVTRGLEDGDRTEER